MDQDFAEALYEAKSGSRSSDRQAQRKAWQLCRQVQRALNLAIEGRNIHDGLAGLFVEDVTPAPDCGRLLVHVVFPANCRLEEAMSALHRDAPRLRAEVAMAITRKRVPELSFVPALGGGVDE